MRTLWIPSPTCPHPGYLTLKTEVRFSLVLGPWFHLTASIYVPFYQWWWWFRGNRNVPLRLTRTPAQKQKIRFHLSTTVIGLIEHMLRAPVLAATQTTKPTFQCKWCRQITAVIPDLLHQTSKPFPQIQQRNVDVTSVVRKSIPLNHWAGGFMSTILPFGPGCCGTNQIQMAMQFSFDARQSIT